MPDINMRDCPAGCGEKTPVDVYACQADWFRLPRYLRTAICSAWRQRHWDVHAHWKAKAETWYREHPLPQVKPEPAADQEYARVQDRLAALTDMLAGTNTARTARRQARSRVARSGSRRQPTILSTRGPSAARLEVPAPERAP